MNYSLSSFEQDTNAPFQHLLNNHNQRVLFYNLALVANQHSGWYKQMFCYFLLAVAVTACVLVYLFARHKQKVPLANPFLEQLEDTMLDSMRAKYKLLRRDSFQPDSELTNISATASTPTASSASSPMSVAMRQIQHEGKQRKEHKKQKKVSFAATT